jgi:hypothetical protein
MGYTVWGHVLCVLLSDYFAWLLYHSVWSNAANTNSRANRPGYLYLLAVAF